MSAMEPSLIEEVRLTSFKSFRDATLPLDGFTLLVGRNGSGKSNALDGLWVLSRLAHGTDIRDAIEGNRDTTVVRGGVAGCAPFGKASFSLGCSVRTAGQVVDLDVTIRVEPSIQIVDERLAMGDRVLLQTDPPDEGLGDIAARWDNRTQGPNPSVMFRSSQLLCTQALGRIPATEAGQLIHLSAARVLAALRAVFVLDPVPHQMRQYVPRKDVRLRRDAENLSAAVASLVEFPATKNALRLALAALNEQHIADIGVSASDLDDVMLTLSEGSAGHPVSARVMSDGSLRFLAILVALMQAPTIDTMPEALASEDAVGQTTVVIEELENGLHASQAAELVARIRDQVKQRRVRVLATGHSPALLDALTGDEHRNVVVCQRDAAGESRLTRLVDLPEYFNIVAAGTLGKAAVHDRLRSPDPDAPASSFLDELLGGTVS